MYFDKKIINDFLKCLKSRNLVLYFLTIDFREISYVLNIYRLKNIACVMWSKAVFLLLWCILEAKVDQTKKTTSKIHHNGKNILINGM